MRRLVAAALFGLTACGAPSSEPRLPGITAEKHEWFPITSGVHAIGRVLDDGPIGCASCHDPSADSFTDITCFNCHGHPQALTDLLHGTSPVLDNYAYAASRCYGCHGDGAKVPFQHLGVPTGTNSRCAYCHEPGAAFAALPVSSFDHASIVALPSAGGPDCGACHVTTTWQGATGAPAEAFDPARDVLVTALIPTYVGAEITTLTPRAETLTMPMKHDAEGVPASLRQDCGACHAQAAEGVYRQGDFHRSLETLGLAQPTACLECHAMTASMPVGLVGPTQATRTPPSGAMKHDAVLWINTMATSTPAVAKECSPCHAPPAGATRSWATDRTGVTPARYHASLADAAIADPSSCVDCHANSRPNRVLDATNATLPAGARWSFDHSAAMTKTDCTTCHAASARQAFSSWSGGVFHLPGSTTPATCLPCHEGDRPATDEGWSSPTYRDSPFDYGTNVRSVPHGDGQDCAMCHAGPGAGAWGGTQNWQGGHFSHDPATTPAGRTCRDCHTSQRPDLLPGTTAAAVAALLDGFDHALSGTGECRGCHQATVMAARYVHYFNPATGTFPGGDWTGAENTPSDASDPSQTITITALIPAYAGTSIVRLSPLDEHLPMNMDHATASIPRVVVAVCANCHPGAATATYYPGVLHASLANLGQAQPESCGDCHAVSMPTGFVGPLATSPVRAPPSGEMKHDAVAWVNSAPTGTALVSTDCGLCHMAPGAQTTTWGRDTVGAARAKYHAALVAAGAPQPGSCLDCHANSRPTAAITSATAQLPAGLLFDHTASAAGDCAACHSTGAPSYTAWSGGKYHLASDAAPATCLPCHEGERPTSTAGWQDPSYRGSPFDYGTNSRGVTHGRGEDCVMCHAGPGTGAWGSSQNWQSGHFSHDPATTPAGTTCRDCHTTQRPDLLPNLTAASAAALLSGFDHSISGTGECKNCHQATVTANAYVHLYNPATQALPGGDWHGAETAPSDATDPQQDVVVDALIPTYFGTSILRVTPASEHLEMHMDHTTATIPASLMAACADCHEHADAGEYYPGTLHAALARMGAAQPATCADCHQVMPTGFVGPLDSARTPQSGEMKHDAVVWLSNMPTTTPAVAAECSVCHVSPSATPATWATNARRTTPAQYHASLAAAAQPTSCLDCHASSRPTSVLTAASAQLPAGLAFDHTTATGDCTTCHGGTASYTAWSGGKYHLAGGAAPSTCLPCHEGERPTSTATWVSPNYQRSPFDYVTNVRGIPHGDAQDCAMCHAGPGTGAWGSTQNWQDGRFSHDPATTPAGATCRDCHTTQRPDLLPGMTAASAAALLQGFDHAVSGAGECKTCHQPTVTAGSYVSLYNPATNALPGGDWRGAQSAPVDSSDPRQDIVVNAQIPTYVGTSITRITAQAERLGMHMSHVTASIPAAVLGACGNCHAGAASGTYYPGTLHAALAASGVAQPSTCGDCHAPAMPTGLVGPLATSPVRAPPSGEMKHDAVVWRNGAPTVTAAVTADCAVCHVSPTATPTTWATNARLLTPAQYHASLTAAALGQPTSCLDCHANSRPTRLLTSANAALAAGLRFDHTAAAAMAECTTCHLDAGAASYTAWSGGKYHLAGGASPATCLPCHEGERPTSTATWVSTTYRRSPFDYVTNSRGVTHGDAQDCAMCHSGPGTGTWGTNQNWQNGQFSHDPATTPAGTTCRDCHTTQRPDLQPGMTPASAAALLQGFDHSVAGTGECKGCHQPTVTAGNYVDYDNPSTGTLPGGDWRGAQNTPSDAFDPAQTIAVSALVPSYSGTSISTLTQETEQLTMHMDHVTPSIPASLLAVCEDCHVSAAVGLYYPGVLHAALANLGAAQPTACADCHTPSTPTGFVGPTATSPARTPASGEMKHDAVAWVNGAPGTTHLVTADCGTCHVSPGAQAYTFANNRALTTPAQYHAPLATAGVAQPTSCLDCHANSRPAGILTSANARLAAGLQFDHGAAAAAGECASCHATGTYASWSGGRYHVTGSLTPSTCLPCHAGERPIATTGWTSATYTASPFDYGTNAQGATHGDGLDCVTCHAGPGAGGVWGGAQSWTGGQFRHGAGTVSANTCIACHATQRPDLQPGTNAAAMALILGFDHATNGTGDCIGCHAATVGASAYVNYTSPTTHTLPGGDWAGGVAYPGATPASSTSQSITVLEINLSRSGIHNLVTGMSSVSATMHPAMLHTSVALAAALGAGTNPDYTRCWHCHTNTNGSVTAYSNGVFHASLDTFSATPGGAITPLAQPTAHCGDCHVSTRPAGIVERAGSELRPMDHAALFSAPVVLNGVSVSGVADLDCSACHTSITDYTDGQFHTRIGAAVPADCTTCHYPVMADAAAADLTSGTDYVMRHGSTQLTFQNCLTCHTTALGAAATANIRSTAWSPGSLHAHVGGQPATCNECHTVSVPAASTQSSVVYALALGGTATNGGQWMNHGSSWVVGRDCAVCHAGDAQATGSTWRRSDSFHTGVPNATTCQECHGTTNGNGATIGTRNNLPAGLTNARMVSTATSDPATGVPAGTHAQINHGDLNVTGHDCNFCHTQVGASSAPGVQGAEWAQATFHTHFTGGQALVMNGTTGRCSNCHLNVKPGATFTAFDHSPYSGTSVTDCAGCHGLPGTGTLAAPNWLGASPLYVSVGGFVIPSPPAAVAGTVQAGIANLPHPSLGATAQCTDCHTTAAGGRNAHGYDHASALITNSCNPCHEAGSDLIGTPWNGVTAETAGAGDTRPWSLTSVTATYSGNTRNVTWPNHFYPVDCKECHLIPTGYGYVTTGTAYRTNSGAWGNRSTSRNRNFPHDESKMTRPSTCLMCHNPIPD